MIIPSVGMASGTQAVPYDAGGSVDDWRPLGKIVFLEINKLKKPTVPFNSVHLGISPIKPRKKKHVET